MEPTDLKNERPDDAQIEAWYRAHLASNPLRDDGFSQRVLLALPPARQQSAKTRRLFCLIGGLIGAATVRYGIAQADFNSLSHSSIPTLEPETLSRLFSPAMGLAVALTAGCLWYVFRPRLNFWPRF